MFQPAQHGSPLARIMGGFGRPTVPDGVRLPSPEGAVSTPPIVPIEPAFNPRRAALADSLLVDGLQGPHPRDETWGSLAGDLAKVISGGFLGRREQKRAEADQQAQAEREAQEEAARRTGLAEVLGGLGAGVSPDQAALLADNTPILNEVLERTRPATEGGEAADPLTVPFKDGFKVFYNDAGEARQAGTPMEARAGAAEGFYLTEQPEVEEAAAVEPRLVEGADGYQYWVTPGGEATRAIPGAEIAAATEEAAEPKLVKAADGFQYWVTPDGRSTRAVPGIAPPSEGGSAEPPKLNEKQTGAMLAVNRMTPAMEELFTPDPDDGRTLYERLADGTAATAASVPWIGNYLVPEDYQRALSAVREVVGAGLRFETGAAITEQEVEDSMDRYAPVPGDSPATIREKAQRLNRFLDAARQIVPESVQLEGGYGGSPVSPTDMGNNRIRGFIDSATEAGRAVAGRAPAVVSGLTERGRNAAQAAPGMVSEAADTAGDVIQRLVDAGRKVQVQSPDGNIFEVPAARLREAIQAGGVLIGVSD